MAIMTTDLDFDSTASLLEATENPETRRIVEYCLMMARRLGVRAGIVPQDPPEAAPLRRPPILAG